MNQEYTEEQWEEEMRLVMDCGQHVGYPENANQWGSCNLECPSCHGVGFYGPKREPWPPPTPDEITRKYRACKWCGFWQEAWGSVFDRRGGDPYQGTIISHKNCGKGKTWGTAGGDRRCEECNDDIVEEGGHEDDPVFQQAKRAMDNMHQNIPRIPAQ